MVKIIYNKNSFIIMMSSVVSQSEENICVCEMANKITFYPNKYPVA